MESYLHALRSHDLRLLLSLFHEDARIDSKAASGVVSKDQYASTMAQTLPFMSHSYFRDLLIRVQGGAAIVYGLSRYDSRRGPGQWRRRTWKFGKQDGRWKIIETHYHEP